MLIKTSIKIRIVSICPREVSLEYEALLKKTTKRMGRDGTKVDIDFVKEGYSEVESYYQESYNKLQVVKSIYGSAKNGCDAAVIGCFLDSGLLEARSIVDIPVTGPFEASMAFASSFGGKFSIITLSRPTVPKIERLARAYGVSFKLASIRHADVTSTEARIACKKPKETANILKELAIKAVNEDEAELVIPGCTILSTILTASKMYEVEGAPILDGVVAAIKIAESLVDLKRMFGMKVSRLGLYSTFPGWEKEIQIQNRHIQKMKKSMSK